MSPKPHKLNKRKESWAGLRNLGPSQLLPLRLGDYRPSCFFSLALIQLYGERLDPVSSQVHTDLQLSQVGPFLAPYSSFFMVGNSTFSHAVKL